MENTYLVAGLGNPGREYIQTRHNAGFMAVERCAVRWRAGWSFEGKFEARLARAEVQGRRVILCEPQTYMNVSGAAVGAVTEFFKLPVERVLIVVDDADLKLGEVRLRESGSSGGHHGLDSIEQRLGTRKYARLRVGIGRTESGVRQITGHVLGCFGPEEAGLLDRVLDRVVRQVECWVTAGIMKAMNDFNGAVQAPMPKETK